jgi:hypothetical protein
MADRVTESVNMMLVLPSQPGSYSAAQAAKLAEMAIGPGDTAPYSSGDARGLQVAGRQNVPVIANGTATHLALVNTALSELVYITTCNPLVMEIGETINMASFVIAEVGQPV